MTPTSMLPAASSWSDAEDDTIEEARFLGPRGKQILAIVHRPATRPSIGAVVICGSIFEDFHVNYRIQVLLSRELARRGVASVRFHYRGFGNSDMLPDGAVSFETMLADTVVASEFLRELTGVEQPVWCGSRVGALVAAHQAVEAEDAPLVLWAPLHSGAEFFRGMSRASMLAGVRAQARQRQSDASTEQQLSTEESVEMLGNRVRRESYDDLRVRELPAECGARPVLLVQLGTTGGLTPLNEKLVSRWRASGATVAVERVQTRQLWMIPEKFEAVDARPETAIIVGQISDWITNNLPGDETSPGDPGGSAVETDTESVPHP